MRAVCVCGRPVSGYAEDPTLYLDANGIIHMIAHGACDFSVLQILVVINHNMWPLCSSLRRLLLHNHVNYGGFHADAVPSTYS